MEFYLTLRSEVIIMDKNRLYTNRKNGANLFFNLINDLHEKASAIITSNKKFDKWLKMMIDEIIKVAILDQLLHHLKYLI